MSREHVSHYPFPLSRVAPRGKGLHQTLRGSTFEQAERELSVKAPLRAIAVRIIGAIAIGGAVAGLVTVADHSGARDAIIDWITFGTRTGSDHDVQKGTDVLRP